MFRSTSCTYNVLLEAMGAFPITNSKPDGPYSLLMPLKFCCSTVEPSKKPRRTTTIPITGLPLSSSTVPPIPAQLQTRSGWMSVLSIAFTDVALNGAFGVLVGFGVRVGGTSEKGVSVESGVNVGRGVLVGVHSGVGLAVHVGSSLMGSGVCVGGAGTNKPPPPGCKGFNDEFGSRKMIAKYPTIQNVSNNTTIVRIFHVRSGESGPNPRNKLFIYITPLIVLLWRKHHICKSFLLFNPILQSLFL